MSEALLVLDKVVKRFGSHVAVDGIDLQISRGEFLAIMGPSGCGKTTTLRMIAGLEQPSEGEIRLNGTRMNELKPWQRDTPLVWQNLALFPHLNVVRNVEFGLKMRRVGARERRERAMNWLERMSLAQYANRNIAQLSGG
ncbi:MAG: ABC transporter ATP-binding protein, partial [Proteobacteria bacterium]|nr:ABC transporter ATP-binding protein [Pseudomonadota bacterium]